jgi:hypothetical protein
MVSITNQDSQVFTFNDGDVGSVQTTQTSEVDVQSTPGSDQDQTFITDLNGVVMRIVVTGELKDATTTRVSGETVLTIEEQVAFLDGLQTGLQTAREFSTLFRTKNVIVEKFETTEMAGQPNNLPFTLNLVVGL